eukprot:GHVQ01009563.1.p1 GENE.GHVQ01009563.1~~GHVQ01009563.1.p1  ORF type:complete len:566 (+),score=46.89 GHVQ01009563.1:138-1700(+)
MKSGTSPLIPDKLHVTATPGQDATQIILKLMADNKTIHHLIVDIPPRKLRALHTAIINVIKDDFIALWLEQEELVKGVNIVERGNLLSETFGTHLVALHTTEELMKSGTRPLTPDNIHVTATPGQDATQIILKLMADNKTIHHLIVDIPTREQRVLHHIHKNTKLINDLGKFGPMVTLLCTIKDRMRVEAITPPDLTQDLKGLTDDELKDIITNDFRTLWLAQGSAREQLEVRARIRQAMAQVFNTAADRHDRHSDYTLLDEVADHIKNDVLVLWEENKEFFKSAPEVERTKLLTETFAPSILELRRQSRELWEVDPNTKSIQAMNREKILFEVGDEQQRSGHTALVLWADNKKIHHIIVETTTFFIANDPEKNDDLSNKVLQAYHKLCQSDEKFYKSQNVEEVQSPESLSQLHKAVKALYFERHPGSRAQMKSYITFVKNARIFPYNIMLLKPGRVAIQLYKYLVAKQKPGEMEFEVTLNIPTPPQLQESEKRQAQLLQNSLTALYVRNSRSRGIKMSG